MIINFKNEISEGVWLNKIPKGFPKEIVASARRKLSYLNVATTLNDLNSPPGNKLHPLIGDRNGQHEIWINNKYRICFLWGDDGNAHDVEIIDYH